MTGNTEGVHEMSTPKEVDVNSVSKMSQTLKEDDINTATKVYEAPKEQNVVSGSLGISSSNVTDSCIVPEATGDGQLEPKIGMMFHSEDQAFKFYNSYAKRKGFSVRKDHLSRRKDGSVRYRHYVCSNEGTRKDHHTYVTKKLRAIERTNCLARIEYKVNRENIWTVTKFIDDHNHPLASPNEIHMLRSHRKKLLPVQHAFVTETGTVQTTRTYVSQAQVTPGMDNAWLKNQSYYLLQTSRTRDLEKGDAQFLLDFLKEKQLEDPSFFYAVQVDGKDRLTNFFWADGRSMLDYSSFGDAVLFDTTYRASMYDIPFASFVGINHYKQIVIFGAALLLDETTESFVWLFKTFLAAASGRQPKTILTDHCAAISEAIGLTLPDTYHQLSLWHLTYNALKVFPHIYNDASSFEQDLKGCMYESCSEVDFEKGWENLITKYNLRGNAWFENLYAARDKWSLVYCKNSFCAIMATKQWSKNMENHFKMLFYRSLSPTKFIMQYQKALIQLREEELYEDYKLMQSKPTLMADIPMLVEASEAYTPIMYKEFEDEYKSQLACLCERVALDGTVCTFRVSAPQKHSYGLVEYDKLNVLVTCSCRKFETMGILCMHALKVLNNNNILHLPSHYIMKRWTRYAKDMATSNSHQPVVDSNGQELLTSRYSQVCRKAIAVAAKGAFSREILELVEHGLDRFIAEMENSIHSA